MSSVVWVPYFTFDPNYRSSVAWHDKVEVLTVRLRDQGKAGEGVAYLWFIIICVTWGSSFILMKKAALALSPVEIATWRVVGGAITLGLICWWRRTPGWFRGGDWRMVLFVVVIGYAWPYAVQPWLVARHDSAFIAMTVSFVPLLTVLISVPMLRVYPTARQTVGVLGALVCLAMLVLDGIHRAISVADLLLAGTVPLGYAVANISIRRWLAHVPSLSLTFQSLALSSVLLLPIAMLETGPQPTGRDDWRLAIMAVAILGILSTGVATWLFIRLIHEQGPLFAGMATNLVPIGAVLWGWVDGERVTGLQIAAVVGIVAMVALVQFGAASRPVLPRPTRAA